MANSAVRLSSLTDGQATLTHAQAGHLVAKVERRKCPETDGGAHSVLRHARTACGECGGSYPRRVASPTARPLYSITRISTLNRSRWSDSAAGPLSFLFAANSSMPSHIRWISSGVNDSVGHSFSSVASGGRTVFAGCFRSSPLRHKTRKKERRRSSFFVAAAWPSFHVCRNSRIALTANSSRVFKPHAAQASASVGECLAGSKAAVRSRLSRTRYFLGTWIAGGSRYRQ
jgi:hypothetical protein